MAYEGGVSRLRSEGFSLARVPAKWRWAWDGLVTAVPCWEGCGPGPADLVTGVTGTFFAGAGYAQGLQGPELSFVASSYVYMGDTVSDAGEFQYATPLNADVTIAAIHSPTSTSQTGVWIYAGAASYRAPFALVYSLGGNQLYSFWNDNNANGPTTGAVTFVPGTRNFVIGRRLGDHADTPVGDIFVNGRHLGTDPAMALDAAWDGADFQYRQAINKFGGFNGYMGTGSIGNILIWNRALSDAEVAALSDDPWGPLQQESLTYVFLTAAATGDSTATLDGSVPTPALSALGDFVPGDETATLSGSVPVPALASIGDVATAGELVGTVPAPTMAGEANTELSGTLVDSVPAPTLGALAEFVPLMVGELAGAVPAPTAVGEAYTTTTAELVGTVPTPSSSGEADTALTGEAPALSVPTPTLSALIDAELTGEAPALSVPAPTLTTASAEFGASAELATVLTLGLDSSAGFEATASVDAAVVLSLASEGSFADASLSSNAELTGAVPAPALTAASGDVLASGEVNAAVPVPATAIVGDVPVSGEAVFTVAVSVTALVDLSVEVQVSPTVPAPTLDSAGTFLPFDSTATLSGSVPAPALSADGAFSPDRAALFAGEVPAPTLVADGTVSLIAEAPALSVPAPTFAGAGAGEAGVELTAAVPVPTALVLSDTVAEAWAAAPIVVSLDSVVNVFAEGISYLAAAVPVPTLVMANYVVLPEPSLRRPLTKRRRQRGAQTLNSL